MIKRLRFEKINETNLELITKLQNIIFIKEDARENYIECLKNNLGRKEIIYWLVYKDNKPIGISGLYSYHEYPEDAWLGWFGVLPEERKRGYGSDIFDFFEKYAKKQGYKRIRLYTESYNETAINFYSNKGMVFEKYLNTKEKIESMVPILIFSKDLNNMEVKKWNNQYLGLTGNCLIN